MRPAKSGRDKSQGSGFDRHGPELHDRTRHENDWAASLEYLPSYEDDSSLALINPAYNAYDIEYSSSNCPAFPFFEGVSFRGLATYDADLEEVILIANGLWAGDPSGQVFVLER